MQTSVLAPTSTPSGSSRPTSRLGMLAGGSETLGYAVEALLLAGDLDAAQRQVEEALRIADDRRERVYLPQLLILQAEIARARGQPTAALASVRSAIEEARSQEAPWLELRLPQCDRWRSETSGAGVNWEPQCRGGL